MVKGWRRCSGGCVSKALDGAWRMAPGAWCSIADSLMTHLIDDRRLIDEGKAPLLCKVGQTGANVSDPDRA